MQDVILRPAARQDAGRMLAVYAPYVERTTASWEYEVPSRPEFARRVEEHQAAGFPWLVAEAGGAVLGYAYAGRFGARRGYDWDAEVSIYLSPDAHRRHVGKALYGALLALLYRQGYHNCYALVTHPNEASALFHKAMGFRELARLPGAGYKAGTWLDLSYFWTPLAPAVPQPTPPVPFQALDPGEVRRILVRAARLITWREEEA